MRSSALDLGGGSPQASDPGTPQPLTISGAPILAWLSPAPSCSSDFNTVSSP